MNLKFEIATTILENRPKLGKKSLASYVSTLRNLPKKMNAKDDIQLNFFSDEKKEILNHLVDMDASKRKSILSALYALTQDEEYRTSMLVDAKEINSRYRNQTKSEKERDNWMHWEEIMEVYNMKKKETQTLFKKKILTKDEFLHINSFVLLSMFILFPPRRVMDYAEMKIRNFDKSDDNYISKN